MKKFYIFLISIFQFFGSNAQWMQTGGPEGGQINCLERVNTQIWAGTMGGVYYSTNDGSFWQRNPEFDQWCLDITSFDDTVIVLYQTMEINQFSSLEWSLYSRTSFDNGTTWTTPILIEGNASSLTSNLYRSHNFLFTKGNFDYYVSYDYGITWSIYNSPFGANSAIYVSANDGKQLLAEVHIPGTPPTLYYTNDGAQTWLFIDSTYNSVSALLIDSMILLQVNYYDTVFNSHIIKTIDLGVTWDTVYSAQVAVNSGGLIYIDNKIYKFEYPDYKMSTDFGNTWTSVNFINDYYLSYDMILLSNGDYLNYVYPTGLVRYNPLSNTFIHSHTGIKSPFTTKLAATNGILYAGTSENTFKSTDAGATWSPLPIKVASITDFVFRGDTVIGAQENYQGYILRSFDNGLSWDTIPAPVGSSWSSPTSIEELNGVLYLSGDDLWYSNDWGFSWNALAPWPSIPGTCLNSLFHKGSFTTINNELFIVTNNGVIFKYDSQNQNWIFLYCSTSGGFGTGNEIYGLGNFIVMSGRVGMAISYDQGNTWIPISFSNTPFGFAPRNLVEINGVWFGTLGTFGVYFSIDQGNTWQQVHTANSPFYARGGLTVVNNILFSASSYSGVWRRAGAFESISGNVYYDVNNNGIKDVGENSISQVIIKTNTTNFYATSDTLGNYSLLTDAIGDTIKAIVPASFATSNPTHYIANGTAINQDFGIYIAPNIQDLSVDITNVNVFRPGFETTINLNVKNNGSVIIPAQAELILDSLLQFKSSVPPPDIQNGDTLTWNINAMNFLDQINIPVVVETFFASTLGDTINCTATVLPITNDTLPQNNISLLNEIIVGSYDPNDKQCVQGEFFTPAQLSSGEELQFIIRFQNEGTYPADFVIIKDTLSHYLDLSTFRIISHSHDMQWSLSGTGIASFDFYNIFLPPAIVDELGSHGYVKYGVKAKETVSLGTAITNTAYIYFDFNPPIITNTTTTLIADPFVTDIEITPAAFKDEFQLKIYPNPARDIINIELTGGVGTVKNQLILRDINGKIVQLKEINGIDKFSVIDMANGIYIGTIILKENHQSLYFKIVVNKD